MHLCFNTKKGALEAPRTRPLQKSFYQHQLYIWCRLLQFCVFVNYWRGRKQKRNHPGCNLTCGIVKDAERTSLQEQIISENRHGKEYSQIHGVPCCYLTSIWLQTRAFEQMWDNKSVLLDIWGRTPPQQQPKQIDTHGAYGAHAVRAALACEDLQPINFN